MGTLILLLAFPVIWPFMAKLIWKNEITIPELGINLLAGVLVAAIGYHMSLYSQAADVEIHNGRVLSKASERVSCEHSYQCNCHESCSGSGSSRSCSTVCSTCYEHSYDVDWNLHTDIGKITIDRINRQGTKEPPRFTTAQVGDPVSLARSYQNYIKAAPNSLFNAATEASAKAMYEGKIPTYPASVYDYHYVDRVLSLGVAIPDLATWEKDLARLLSRQGPSREVNAVIVFTKEASPMFASALRAEWLGGKKNDVIVVLGTPNYPEIGWVRVFSWSDAELFKVELRDDLQELGTVDREKVMSVLENHIKSGFVRKHMRDFEYLKNEIELPAWLLTLLALLSIGCSIGTSVVVSRNEYSTANRRY